MPVPTITTVQPANGPTLGRTFVEITGTNALLPATPPANGPSPGTVAPTVEVLFDGEPATGVVVRPDDANPPNGTIVGCLTPPHVAGATAVQVRNLDSAGVPIPGESVTLPGGFTFDAVDLTVETDLTRLVRELLRDFKKQLLRNFSLTVHTDYDDTTSDGLNVTALAELPAVLLIGPDLVENRFYSLNEQPESPLGSGVKTRRVPYTVDLEFDIIGVSDHKVEFLNLMSAATSYFHDNKFLSMQRDPNDASAGQARYEIDFAENGEFKTNNRQNETNVRSFRGSIVIRGFDIERLDGTSVGVGAPVDEVAIQTESAGVVYAVGPSPGC